VTLAAAAALILVCGARLPGQRAASGTVVDTPVRVAIDPAREHQIIEGFGATTRSGVHQGRDTLGPELRARALDALYRQVRLSVGNIDAMLLESPGSFAERRNDNNDPKSIEWTGFQTAAVDATKALLLDRPEAAEFKGYFLAQRVTTRWQSTWLAELRQRNYGRYIDEAVEHVVAGQVYWRDKHGIVPRYHQLFNEPLSGNTELAGGDRSDLADIVKRAGQRLQQLGFQEVRFVVPNEVSVDQSLRSAEVILADRGARRFVGAIGYHPYGDDGVWSARVLDVASRGEPDPQSLESRARLRELAAKHGVQVWMCETSSSGSAVEYSMFRARAIHIRFELVYANASVYQGMNSIWDRESHQEHTGGAEGFGRDGDIVLVDQRQKTVTISAIGRAIGHYARWLTPGAAVRLESSSSDPRVMTAAFRDGREKRLVAVLINNASEPRTVQLDAGTASVSGSLTGEQSTEKAYWTALNSVPLGGQPPSLVLPPLSVTTVAMPLAESGTSARR
jgi:O-glycosyl hydrolase